MRLLALALLTISSLALAHGAPPDSTSLVARVGNDSELLAGTTFGTLLSSDKGKTWRWICEEAMSSAELVDPLLVWTKNGNILAGDFFTLVVSRDRGCTWSDITALSDTGVSDIEAHPTDPAKIFVTTGRYNPNTNSLNGIYASLDEGVTFSPLVGADGGAALMRENTYFSGMRVAPSQPSRLYASAFWYDPYAGWLYRSDDNGLSWTEVFRITTDITSLSMLGVSPTNADVVFLATTGVGGNKVLRSENGGASFETVSTLQDPVKSIDFSPDGQTVYLAQFAAIWRSTDAGKTFEKLSTPEKNTCVKSVNGAVYACGSPSTEGWSLARTENVDAGFTPVMRLQDIAGALECPADTPVAKVCGAFWPSLQTQLKQFGDGGTEDGGTLDGGEEPAPKRGCGCSGAPATVPFVLMLALGLSAVLRRRAR